MLIVKTMDVRSVPGANSLAMSRNNDWKAIRVAIATKPSPPNYNPVSKVRGFGAKGKKLERCVIHPKMGAGQVVKICLM